MGQIKGLISDLDGTLVDTFEANYQTYKVVFKMHNIDMSRQFYEENFGLRIDDLCKKLNIIDKDEINTIKVEKSNLYPLKFNYLKLAESAYLRAIELEPRYVRSLYGLGVLYVFELDQCEKAIPYLETALSVETKNTDIMFVLARAYYVEGQYDNAVSLYDKIISVTKSEQKKKSAEANKKIALDASYAN